MVKFAFGLELSDFCYCIQIIVPQGIFISELVFNLT